MSDELRQQIEQACQKAGSRFVLTTKGGPPLEDQLADLLGIDRECIAKAEWTSTGLDVMIRQPAEEVTIEVVTVPLTED